MSWPESLLELVWWSGTMLTVLEWGRQRTPFAVASVLGLGTNPPICAHSGSPGPAVGVSPLTRHTASLGYALPFRSPHETEAGFLGKTQTYNMVTVTFSALLPSLR